jgi:hypothetical protein
MKKRSKYRRPDRIGNQFAVGNRGGRGGPIGNQHAVGAPGGHGGPVGNHNSTKHGFSCLVNQKGNLPEGLPEKLRVAMEAVFPIAAERRSAYEQQLRERLGGKPILPGHFDLLNRIERCERIVLYADVVTAGVGAIRKSKKDDDWDFHGVVKTARLFDRDRGEMMTKLGLYEVDQPQTAFLDQPHIPPSPTEAAPAAHACDQSITEASVTGSTEARE